MPALSLEQANSIIAATFAEAKKTRCRPMSAIILDAGGRVKAFQKSKLVLQKANDKPLFMQSIDNLADYPLFLEGGGQLIRAPDGEVVGAIGVTGDANEMDDICAIAGIHAVGLRADSDFFHDAELMRALSIHKTAPLKDPRKRVRPVRAQRNGRNGGKNRPGPQAAKSGP
jgi:uncharacterized protein GlcG (DUF336 family)